MVVLSWFFLTYGKPQIQETWILPRSSSRSRSCHEIASTNSVGTPRFCPMNAESALQKDSAILAWQDVNLNTTDPISRLSYAPAPGAETFIDWPGLQEYKPGIQKWCAS